MYFSGLLPSSCHRPGLSKLGHGEKLRGEFWLGQESLLKASGSAVLVPGGPHTHPSTEEEQATQENGNL